MRLMRSREGMSPAESIPGETEQKVHPGADPAKRQRGTEAVQRTGGDRSMQAEVESDTE